MCACSLVLSDSPGWGDNLSINVCPCPRCATCRHWEFWVLGKLPLWKWEPWTLGIAAHLCMLLCGGQRTKSRLLFPRNCLPVFLFFGFWGFFFESLSLARLPGQWPQESDYDWLPNIGVNKSILAYFYAGSAGSHPCTASTPPTESPPQPLKATFSKALFPEHIWYTLFPLPVRASSRGPADSLLRTAFKEVCLGSYCFRSINT